jgi:hypothetical protein
MMMSCGAPEPSTGRPLSTGLAQPQPASDSYGCRVGGGDTMDSVIESAAVCATAADGAGAPE